MQCPYCKITTDEYIIYKKNSNIHNIDFSATNLINNDLVNKPDLYKCKNCKLIISELCNKKFENKYIDAIDHIHIKNIKYKKIYFKSLIKKLKSYFNNNVKLLEIGSYYGAFASEIIGFVQNFDGIELSAHARKYAKDNFKINYLENFDQIYSRKDYYDVVVMWDTIEHLDDPKEMLSNINKILKKNGHFIFTTMNMDSLFAKILRSKYQWIMM